MVLESTILHTITPEKLQALFDALGARIDGLDKSEKYFTREEVAKMFGADNSTLHNWNKSGVLKANRIGGKVIYKQSEIEKAIK